MDAVNWLVHGKHGDEPECACPIVAAYVIQGNDAMPDDIRQRLLGYLHRIAGSRNADSENARLRVLVLAAARMFVPLALDATGLTVKATKLRLLPDDTTFEDLEIATRAARTAGAEEATWAAWPARTAGVEAATWAALAAREAGAEAAKAAARAATRAAAAAHAAGWLTGNWDAYFDVLDAVLNAGPQGEPWSADTVADGTARFVEAGGLLEAV